MDLRMNTMDPNSRLNIARRFFVDGEYEEALVASEEALGIEPRNYDAWFIKGAALYQLERYEEALEAFEEAIDLKPEVIDIWIVKGSVLHNLKRDEEALEAYRKALKICHQTTGRVMLQFHTMSMTVMSPILDSEFPKGFLEKNPGGAKKLGTKHRDDGSMLEEG